VTFVIAHATTLPTASIEFRIGRLHRYPGYVESVQVRSLGGNERELSFEAGTLREGPVDPETGLPSVECTYMARLQTRVTEGPATAAGHGRCLPWALLAIGAAGHGRCWPWALLAMGAAVHCSTSCRKVRRWWHSQQAVVAGAERSLTFRCETGLCVTVRRSSRESARPF
jgi:hypothetical protein